MTEAQIDYAELLEREDREEAEAETRDAETARENDLWDAGAGARYQDEQRQMARDDEARASSSTRRPFEGCTAGQLTNVAMVLGIDIRDNPATEPRTSVVERLAQEVGSEIRRRLIKKVEECRDQPPPEAS